MLKPDKQLEQFLAGLLAQGGAAAVTESFAWLGAFVLTRDGIIIAASEGFCELLELEQQDLLGMRAIEVVVPEDRAGLEARFAERNTLPYSLHIVASKGETKHVLVVPYLFEALGAGHRLASFTDISELVALKESEQRFEEIFDLAGIGIGRVKPDGSWLECNTKLCELLGYSEAELLQLSFQAVTHPDDLNEDLAHVQEMLEGSRQGYSMEKRYRRREGSYFWARLTVTLVRDSGGEAKYLISLVQDISEEKRTQAELSHSEQRFRSMAEVLPVALYVTNSNTGKCDYINPAFSDYFGYYKAQVETLDSFLELTCPDAAMREQLQSAWHKPASPEEAQIDVHPGKVGAWMRSATGERHYIRWSFVRLKELDYALGIDLTRTRLAEEAAETLNRELGKLALTDKLTGLENRRSFDTALDKEWRRASREGRYLALIMADLDCFKAYNDQYGHPAGDECLRKVGAALKAFANRAGDCVARYGGEEFAILLPGLDAAAAADIAEQIRDSIEQLQINHPDQPGGVVTLSLGVAAARVASDKDQSALVTAADQMLYEAKRAGRNRVVSAQP